MEGNNGKGKTVFLKDADNKAVKAGVAQLTILPGQAFAITSANGKPGFYGKAVDPQTGTIYQITRAVAI